MDLLLNRYHDADYLFCLNWVDGVNLIYKAVNKKTEDNLFKMYLMQFQNMNRKNYLSFEDWKLKILKPSTKTNKSIQETLEMAEKIKQSDEKRNPKKVN